MKKRVSVDEYLQGPETTRRTELVYGVVREPPAPNYRHQSIVTSLTVLLHQHVQGHQLGHVCVSPVDVVLDASRDLVVQPDIIFVAAVRAGIIGERVWGSPDLVVEVLSPSTRQWDGQVRLEWYERYGVRECWLVDPDARSVEVVSLTGTGPVRRTSAGREPVCSAVLPGWAVEAERFFD